ncbi:hypothetical protein P175DRAFT_0439084 [Aspergillus ochraceoroseus IBT 24754]|uniref:Glucose-methanol-choline oxidoreductase N-terminal domain-containing protein n=3 Tax=Aspergillus subgen. Nidulantes TaxID=2720870 RepID=A0A0F8WUD5_9EURO|nr:uncharacterized protein P175DRAFT_0439084 [Aspergillus ochraceoroseus IBT 24754]KKK21190.1 hypothetical protein ARAM_004676 [Aspergillus rambellii]KKK21377.1 hypothetical protein AOCH_000704 [Aspergillus ochraceoroseus]PTU20371.1 hypothetical protein P175DRAFT_0439084 [Aspergillus ochraceoroseus IBT 24754]
MSSSISWDFIVVGSGPAGCAIASRLARSAARPQVLLLEAGNRRDEKALRVDGKRWMSFRQSDTNWGYKTIPQEHCNDREIDFSRGKVLGGSSAINFGVYTVGAQDDYDEWAALVEDDAFRWEKIQERFKSLETFHRGVPDPRYAHLADPKESDHGKDGALRLGYAGEWEPDLPLVLEALNEAGLPLNLDHNSGNPIGMAVGINSAYSGVRTTAADLLRDAPENLTIIPASPVQRVILDGKIAVGVESNGLQYLASKDVIISAGSLDSPKILMHSGIGPADQLEKFNIPVVKDIRAIGHGMRDHPFVPLCFLRNPETNDRNSFFGKQEAMDAAMEQWMIDGTGPWARYASQILMGWFKSDRITQSAEFKALPASTQEFLNRPTVPHYELASHFPIHMLVPELTQDYSYVCFAFFLMNQQSKGEVRLQSSDPNEPLLFNANFLAHPYDRRVCIEAARELLRVTNHEAFKKDTVSMILGPASESDEDILEFCKNLVGSAWHMTGTVKMGKPGQADAAVDSKFRVCGVENLRVADMSVVPVMTNNHTQATAYVTGASCADILIAEYGLDRA